VQSETPDNPNRLAIGPGVSLPESVLAFRFDRSGGPGGQNVNKVATRATLTVAVDDLRSAMPPWAVRRLCELAGARLALDPDRLVISADGSRSQLTNKKECLARLRELVVQAMDRPKPRRRTRIPRGAIERRLRDKRHRSQRKQDRKGED